MEMEQAFKESARQLEGEMERGLSKIQERLSDVSENVTSYVRQYPGRCLLGALATGYIIARLARRL